MDPHAAEKVRSFGTSVFAEMSRLAVQYQAKRAIDADLNQYAVSHGHLRLRAAIASDFGHRFNLDVDKDQHVTIASGATEVIFDAIQAYLGPGDELISFEPFYESYPAAVRMAGGVFKPVRLQPPDWSFTADDLRFAVSERTKVILLNTPHNPTGKVFTRDELQIIADVAQDHDLVVFSDEVYDRILFNGAEHLPIATLPGMWERTLTINSTGKTFSMTGWKIGFAVGPSEMNAALRVVHQIVTFASATPFQEAMAEAIEQAGASSYYQVLAKEYDERRVALDNALTGSGLKTLPIAGSYFLMADISERGFASDVEFCRWLVSTHGVAAVPPSAFYVDPATAPLHARFCFAKKLETIAEAKARLGAAFE